MSKPAHCLDKDAMADSDKRAFEDERGEGMATALPPSPGKPTMAEADPQRHNDFHQDEAGRTRAPSQVDRSIDQQGLRMSAPNARDNPHGILDSDMPVLRTVALVPDKEALIGVLDDQQRRVQAQAASRHLKPNQIYSLGDGAFGVLSSPWPGLPRSVPAKRGADLNPDNEPAPASKKRASGNGPQAIGSAPTRQHSQVAEQGTLSINDDDQSRGSEIDTPERQHKINFLSEKIDVLSEKVKVLSEMIDVLSQTVKALSEKEAILSEKTQVFQDPGHRVLKEDLYFRAAQFDRNLDSEMYSISLQA